MYQLKQIKHALSAGLILALVLPLGLLAQEGVGDVVYVPTPQVVVEEMLSMAKVGPKDFVIDLGSGDGRMVITAAKKFGASGFGVDLDTVLLKISNDSVRREGLLDRVAFFEQNLFETDLSRATVITTYLLPSMNEKLRPKILNLKPGTRVVAHDYHMGEWRPDENKTLKVPEKTVGNPGVSYIWLWTVPAKVAGRWQTVTAGGAPNWEFEFDQTFQMLEGTAKSGSQTVKLLSAKPDGDPLKLEGDQINFVFFTKPGDNATRNEFKGTVSGDTIDGTLRVGAGATQKQQPLKMTLVQRAQVKPVASAAQK